MKRLLRSRDASIVFSLAALTLFCCTLIFTRIIYTGWVTFGFLLWNLCLAWIPFCLSLLIVEAAKRRAHRVALIILAAVWLVFYPNAPYILTDFIHLRERSNIPLWFDLVLIGSCAWNGLLLGFLSLHHLQKLVQQTRGAFMGWVLVVCVQLLSGFGIYVGRFLRWNSWDLLVNLPSLSVDIASRIIEPQTIGVSVLFGVFLLLAYVTIWTMKREG